MDRTAAATISSAATIPTPLPRIDSAAAQARPSIMKACHRGWRCHWTRNACAKAILTRVQWGRLTLATGNPADPPYFQGGTTKGSEWKLDDPHTGKGFESAGAYAVARQLGFSKGEVDWTPTSFVQSYAPG